MGFTSDWTENEDKDLKALHECGWDESCVMCKEYDECIKAKKDQ